MKLLFPRQVPNALTLLRIFLIPFLVFFMANSASSLMQVLALFTFLLAAFTDLIDGMVARHYNAVSEVGKLLDPLADKIMVMAALIMLVAQRSELSGDPYVPGWLVVLLLAREFWVTGLRGAAAAKGAIIQAADSGKLKTFLQTVAITCLLLRELEVPLLGYGVPLRLIGLNLLLFSLFFSFLSAYSYSARVFTLYQGAPQAEIHS